MVSTGRGLPAGKRTARTLIGCGALAVLAACEKAPVVDEPVVRPVRYEVVRAQSGAERRLYSGTTQSELETDLSFRVGGTLIGRPVNVGNAVERGDPIASLDAKDFQVQLDEARAGLARSEAERRNAQASYQRTRDLYENQNASRDQLDTARALSESAEAQYRASAQQVEAAELQLSYTRLTAPQSCTVAQTYAEVNQNVSAGQPIVRVNCGQCAEVVVSVPDTDIARIAPGMNVSATISASPGSEQAGVVQEVGVATGAGGATYPVTIALQERCENLRSGMAVDVTFDFQLSGEGDSNIIVPYVAVGEDRDGNFVFVLQRQDSGLAVTERRAVEVGEVSNRGIVLLSGVASGELVATAGVRRLQPGQTVRLLAADLAE